jgi:hypothetical protein
MAPGKHKLVAQSKDGREDHVLVVKEYGISI